MSEAAAHCKECFVLLSARSQREDAAAYAQFVEVGDAERLLKQGRCSRCGRQAQVIYNRPKELTPPAHT